MFKNLLNDTSLIEGSINKYFNINLSLELLLEKNKNKQEDKKTKQKDAIDKDHPLFMDVLNELEGEIIK